MHSMTYMLYRELLFPIKSTDRKAGWGWSERHNIKTCASGFYDFTLHGEHRRSRLLPGPNGDSAVFDIWNSGTRTDIDMLGKIQSIPGMARFTRFAAAQEHTCRAATTDWHKSLRCRVANLAVGTNYGQGVVVGNPRTARR
jgi:hypothetical protein